MGNIFVYCMLRHDITCYFSVKIKASSNKAEIFTKFLFFILFLLYIIKSKMGLCGQFMYYSIATISYTGLTVKMCKIIINFIQINNNNNNVKKMQNILRSCL